MNSISIPCPLLLSTLAAFLLSSALCIKSATASRSLLPFGPAGCSPTPLMPSCPLHIPPASANPSDTTFPLFNQSSPFLFNFFTINFTDELPLGNLPSALGFALFFRPQLNPFVEIILSFSIPESCGADAGSLLSTCDSTRIQTTTSPSCKELPIADHSDLEDAGSNYSVSLTHNASSAALLVQAKVNYGGGFEITQTLILNSSYLQPDPDDAYTEQNDSIGLFVTYVTGAINVSSISDAPSQHTSLSDSLPPPENHSKSTHSTVVLWVVVGVSVVAFVVVVIILALVIKKRYRGRRPLARSHLAGGRVAPASTSTTRAPFSHPQRESKATPMMATVCPSPPYQTDNFQMSGTASWLKQTNPR